MTDEDALRRVLGARSDLDLGLPAHADHETDPKRKLDEVVAAAHPSARRRRSRTGKDYLQRLGDEVSLTRLRTLPAFRDLEAELRRALAHLGYLAA